MPEPTKCASCGRQDQPVWVHLSSMDYCWPCGRAKVDQTQPRMQMPASPDTVAFVDQSLLKRIRELEAEAATGKRDAIQMLFSWMAWHQERNCPTPQNVADFAMETICKILDGGAPFDGVMDQVRSYCKMRGMAEAMPRHQEGEPPPGEIDTHMAPDPATVQCNRCAGTGVFRAPGIRAPCKKCNGSGKVQTTVGGS